MLRLPWFRLNVLSCSSRSFLGSWSKDTAGDYLCPSLLQWNLVWYPEHNRHSITALKEMNKRMNGYTCICQRAQFCLLFCCCVPWGRGVGMGIGEKERSFLLLFLEGDTQKWWDLRTSEQSLELKELQKQSGYVNKMYQNETVNAWHVYICIWGI